VIANLTLGFWVNALSRSYHDTLWIPALRHAFPRSTGRRKDVWYRAWVVLNARNDIAHHTRIWKRDVLDIERRALQLADWVDDGLHTWLAEVSTVQEVVDAKPTP